MKLVGYLGDVTKALGADRKEVDKEFVFLMKDEMSPRTATSAPSALLWALC